MAQWEIKKTKYGLLKGMLLMANIFILTFFLQENGMGYLACAYEVFALISILLTDSMPEIIGKLMRSRIQKSLGKNAIEVYKSGIVLSVIYAIVGSIFIFAVSGAVSRFATGTLFGANVIRMFIPAFIMMCLSAPLKGFFIGIGTAAPGSLSGIICNLVTLVTSIFAAKIGGDYGSKVATILNNPEFINSYKAFMVPLAVCLGYFVELVFLAVTYLGGAKNTRIADRDMSRYHEPVPELIASIIKGMFPYNITSFVLRGFVLTAFIMFGIFHKPETADVPSNAVYIGAIYGKFLPVVVFLGFFIEFMVICFKNYCIGGIRRNELKFTREKMEEGVHMIMVFGAFLSIALMTIGSSLLLGCFGEDNIAGTDLFAFGCLVVLFMPLAMYFKTFVSYTSKKRAVFILAVVSFVLSSGVMVLVSKTGGFGYKTILLAFVIFFGFIAVGNAFFSMTGFKCRLPLVSYVAIPVGTAALSGVIMMLLNKGFLNIVGGLASFGICFVIGSIANMILLLALRNLSEEELVSMPGGKIIIKFGVAFNFFEY